jgi:hypothetical protein
MNQQAFKIGAKLRGSCGGVGDDRCKQPKCMEEVENQYVLLIQMCTYKIGFKARKIPKESNMIYKEELNGLNRKGNNLKVWVYARFTFEGFKSYKIVIPCSFT